MTVCHHLKYFSLQRSIALISISINNHGSKVNYHTVTMKITVEFIGIARIITREPKISLEVKEGTSFEKIVQKIGELFPDLIGEIIQPDKKNLYDSNMFSLNGEHMVLHEEMGHSSPSDGDRLILMSILSGG